MSHNGDGGHMMNNEQPQPPGQGTTAFNVKHTSVPACIPSTPILATSTSSPTPFTHANTNNDGHANMPTRGDDAPMIRGMMPTTTTTTMMTNVQQFPVGTTYDEAHMLEEPMPHATSKTLAQHDEDKRDPRSHDHDQDGPSIMRTDTNGRHVYAESSAGPAQCTDAKNDEIEALNANNADSALDGVATNYASGNLPPNGHLSSAKPDSNEPSDSVHQQVTQASESKTLSTSNLLENGNAQVSSNDEGGRNGSTSQLAPGVDEEDELEEGEALSDDMASPPRPPVDLSSRGSQQASLRDTSNSDGTAKNVAGGTAKVFKLYIGGLPDKAEFADVKDCFSQFGEIAHIEFKTGYAFIEYTTEEAAKEAIDTYHEGHFLGKMIRVEAVKTATAQKEAIDKGTCFICGEAGHFAKHCPKDPRNAGRLPPRDRGRPIPQRWHPRDRSPVRDRRDFRDRDVDRDRDWDRDRSRQRERDRDRDRDRERDIGRARGRGVDRERGSERDRERDRERLSLLPRDREVDRYVDRGRVGDIDRDRRSDRDLDRLRDADRDRFPPRELDRNHRRRDDRDRREQDREDYGERGPAHTRPIDRDYRSVSAVSRADERLSAHQDASPARGSMRQPAGRGRDGFGQIDRPDTRRDDGMHRSEPPLPQAGYHQGFNNDRLYEPQDRASNRSPGNSERPRHEIYQAIHEVQPAMQVQGPLPPELYVNSDRGFSGGNARHQDMPWHGEHPAEDYQFRPGIPADPRLQARGKHEQEKQRVEVEPLMGHPGPPGLHNLSGSRADVRMRGEYPGDQAMYSHDRRSDLVDQSPRHSAPWPVLSPSHRQHPGTSHDPHLLQQSRGGDRAWAADSNYRGGFPGQAASGPPQPAFNDNNGNHSDYRPRWQ